MATSNIDIGDSPDSNTVYTCASYKNAGNAYFTAEQATNSLLNGQWWSSTLIQNTICTRSIESYNVVNDCLTSIENQKLE